MPKNDLKRKIDPHLYYKQCKKCGCSNFRSIGKMGYCNDCGWHFFVHTIRDLEESYSWPNQNLSEVLGL